MSYRFECKHCGSRFSLEQQRDAHEAECGAVGREKASDGTSQPARGHPCKYCSESFASFGEYGAHRWAAHKEEVLAELARKKAQGKADETKIDAAIQGESANVAGKARPRRVAPAGPASSLEATCPTCGGTVPATTAQLVVELTAAGLSEAQAFEAARIARRVFAQGAAG